MNILLVPIIMPVITGMAVLAAPKRVRFVKESLALLAAAANLAITLALFGKELSYSSSWAGFGFEFSLRLYHFSSFIIAASAAFGFLVVLYSVAFLRDKGYARQFYSYLLLALAFINGAVLADNLIALLFFWEALLLALFGLIAIGRPGAFKTATKAFIIVGVSDLLMMAGIAITAYLAGTFTISKISLTSAGLGGLAFLFLVIGATAKAGSMPFHTWIPDAADDAPLPFMAFFPASLEKLIGIYFLARISLDMFRLEAHSWASSLLMWVGAITIVAAVMMALIQKDYKRLLSYHAISQVGYMILGIGTLVPAGIIGGLFHMLNNSMYKCCLFLTGGAVEKEAGTTDLTKLGGLWKKMPVTFACFAVTALSISGVPPFNGFFSKELVYDGALERGLIFYLAAIVGSFLTAASFLKLGHAAYIDRPTDDRKDVKEAPVSMLIPMVVIALGCIAFGLWNSYPINVLIRPAVAAHIVEGHDFAGFPSNMLLVWITIAVLAAALANHLYGARKNGSGLKAVDHIHNAPVLGAIYDRAEKGFFDPYNIGMTAANVVSRIAWALDRAVDWVYNDLAVGVSYAVSSGIKRAHDGKYPTYVLWSVVATVIVVIICLRY